MCYQTMTTSNGKVYFYVNKTKRTVTAVFYPNRRTTAIWRLAQAFKQNKTGKLKEVGEGIECFGGSLATQLKYVGVAKCHPQDTFDIDKGMKIAKLRAYALYRKDILHDIEVVQAVLEDVSNYMADTQQYHETAYQRVLADLHDYE